MLSRLKEALARSNSVRFAAWLLLFNFSDLFTVLLPSRKEPKSKQRVLFVKLDGVGDYVIWSATFEAIRKIFPSSEYERIVVGNVTWRELAEGESTFDRGIYLDTRRFAADLLYRFKILRQIRALDADIAVNARLTREFLWTDSVVRCSGARERVGCRGIDNLMNPLQERISDRWYTTLTPHLSDAGHQLKSNIQFLAAVFPDRSFDRTLRQPPRIKGPVNESLATGRYAVLILGATSPERWWPIEKFVQMGHVLNQEFALPIVICGSSSERELAEHFRRSFPGDVLDLTGRTTLRELAAILAGSSVTLTNDTGTSHIAIAMGSPTVVIAPGNHPGRFHPYPEELMLNGRRGACIRHTEQCIGCGWECARIRSRSDVRPCIVDVSVDEVSSAVRAVCYPLPATDS